MASSQQAADGPAAEDGEITQVLEFGLGEETYCLDIAYIDEIVDAGELTAIPNSPRHVEGVMDLRGKTTTIIDPKTLLGVAEDGARERIIVFDPQETDEGGTVGWVVDEVYQVRDVAPEQVDEATTAGDDDVRGIVKGDDRFVVWVEPRTQ
ncbi:purine-binding chemotaxis protein CheW [Halorarum halophilum]|uniref:Purine-binding chemotaxis protein CheW n=1 Tax=Halorarum halophilum TaxID=2743090 RepID=A0A7D5K8N4_9EURY|nr:chemotaxis protein CheW [Halobaculum halophilum]QLG28419.1 purine-binding chemotaxis protein CheW [Halobaculum halophilum]